MASRRSARLICDRWMLSPWHKISETYSGDGGIGEKPLMEIGTTGFDGRAGRIARTASAAAVQTMDSSHKEHSRYSGVVSFQPFLSFLFAQITNNFPENKHMTARIQMLPSKRPAGVSMLICSVHTEGGIVYAWNGFKQEYDEHGILYLPLNDHAGQVFPKRDPSMAG